MRTRAIFINTPHNPTGAVTDRKTLEAYTAVAEKHNLLLISDEAYEHVIFDGEKHTSIGSLPAAQQRNSSLGFCNKIICKD